MTSGLTICSMPDLDTTAPTLKELVQWANMSMLETVRPPRNHIVTWHWRVYMCFFYTPRNEVKRGGYTGFTPSVCPQTRQFSCDNSSFPAHFLFIFHIRNTHIQYKLPIVLGVKRSEVKVTGSHFVKITLFAILTSVFLRSFPFFLCMITGPSSVT